MFSTAAEAQLEWYARDRLLLDDFFPAPCLLFRIEHLLRQQVHLGLLLELLSLLRGKGLVARRTNAETARENVDYVRRFATR